MHDDQAPICDVMPKVPRPGGICHNGERHEQNDRGDGDWQRFTIDRTDKGGEGGTVTFAISDKTVEIDGATSLLEAGEKIGIQMPFGCRMGICQTCVLPLESGHVRDFRSGEEHGAGDRINTCVSTASGDCTLKI